MATDKIRLIPPLGISTLSGIVVGVVTLLVINASLLRVPDVVQSAGPRAAQSPGAQPPTIAERDYKPLMERNLFRAKLQVEIPKPKTEKEIEEEALTAAVKGMALKGVMMGTRKKDTYAVIDLGGQNGVWTYETGEVVEKGLALKEIRKDSVLLEKGDFGAILKLFSPVYQRTPGTPLAEPVSQQPQKGGRPRFMGALDLGKEMKGIRKEGAVTIIPKSLAEKLKADNNVVMSSIAVKAAADGLQVVAVDRGSIAEKMGISPDDILEGINGHKLNASQDMNQVYGALKNDTSFDVTLMRGGQAVTLHYEIR